MNDRHPNDETARECRKVLHQNRECPAADTLVSFREDELAPDDAVTVAEPWPAQITAGPFTVGFMPYAICLSSSFIYQKISLIT